MDKSNLLNKSFAKNDLMTSDLFINNINNACILGFSDKSLIIHNLETNEVKKLVYNLSKIKTLPRIA